MMVSLSLKMSGKKFEALIKALREWRRRRRGNGVSIEREPGHVLSVSGVS